MTKLETVGIMCQNCRKPFKTQKVISTNEFGGKRTDFHAHAAGPQPLIHQVYTCTHCGYSTMPREDGDYNTTLKESTSWKIKEEITPLLTVNKKTGETNPIPGSLKYEWAAKILEWESSGIEGDDIRKIADMYLRASWCCVDEKDTEAERYFRLKAAHAFDVALETYGEVEPEERAILTYLVGELYRRAGHVVVAQTWFDQVKQEVTDPKAQEWVVAAAEQQRTSPREWFG